jgi:hypothetical protein
LVIRINYLTYLSGGKPEPLPGALREPCDAILIQVQRSLVAHAPVVLPRDKVAILVRRIVARRIAAEPSRGRAEAAE